MSPYEIKLLLDIYCIVNWFEGRDEPILPETIDKFEDDGLITVPKDYRKSKLTQKGRMHVIQLCNLLYPIEKTVWLDALGNKIPDTL